MSTTIKITRTIAAPPEIIFEMLTTAGGLREWFCREAHTDARKGGRFRVGWWSGYEARGTYTAFAPPRRLAFTWMGHGEPGETTIAATLKPMAEATKVTLVHSGFGTGKKWAGQAEGAAREWNRVLDNLKSVVETGVDPRAARQPRIGLEFDTMKDNSGVLLTRVVPETPAEMAGLQKDDVLTSFNGQRIRTEEELMGVFRMCHAGQRVPVAFLREGKRRRTTVKLGARPVPDIPNDPATLIEHVLPIHARAIAGLRECVRGLSEEQAERTPAPGEWSIKQVLGHLCASERGFQVWVSDIILGREAGWIEARLPEQMAAVFVTAPTVSAILDHLERDFAESRGLVAALTPEHLAYKLRYRPSRKCFSITSSIPRSIPSNSSRRYMS